MATRKHKRSVFNANSVGTRRVRASYDIARSTDENENLWKYVDSLSAADANSPSVRKIIRERARYEVANNSYADGMVDTLTADTVSPRVQLQLGDSELAQRAENDFAAWAKAVKLWKKVRIMRRAKCVDGEAFATFLTNRKVQNRVKLDLRLIECDQIESWYNANSESEIDGIRFDASGNPVSYRILDVHPGDHRTFMRSLSGKWTDADYVLHYFTELRPGQVRGVSELLPALEILGELRLYTKAVRNAAARAAEISGVMQTTLPPESTAAELADPLTMIDSPRNNLVSLPEGWVLGQMKAEQPSTTYEMFKREVINEFARCLSMPYNIAACDSSSYNYASGRLDHQTYDQSIETERVDLESDILDRIYAAWLAEYQTVASLTPAQFDELQAHAWHYAGRGHVDPTKEANADDIRLKNGTLTYSRYWAKRGADSKREAAQWINERVQREVMWNEAREQAQLPPTPFPSDAPATAPDKPEQEDAGQETPGEESNATTEE